MGSNIFRNTERRCWRGHSPDEIFPRLGIIEEHNKQMDTKRIFIRWLEAVDGVEQDLSEKMLSPSLTPDEDVRDVMLDSERATEIFSYLAKYQYASVEHVVISLAWHTMARRGSIRPLDVGDYHTTNQYLEVRHRPETGTPIKNKSNGEHLVALLDEMSDLLDDWLAMKRPSVTDDHDRDLLLATEQGRLAQSTVRTYVYKWTRPCAYGESCPMIGIQLTAMLRNRMALQPSSTEVPAGIRT